MNPRVPDILSRVAEAASRSLDKPSGDARRIDTIERLLDEAQEAAGWPTDERRRFVNDWTLLLLKMLRKIERLGPLGDGDELSRAMTVGLAVLPYVQADALAAHAAAARAATSDHDFKPAR